MKKKHEFLCKYLNCFFLLSKINGQINDLDFYEFDYIFGMDDMNIRHLNELAPRDKTANIELLGSYDYGKDNIIDDPYFVSSFFYILLEPIYRLLSK